MTTIKDVDLILMEIINEDQDPLAEVWLKNDLIKKRLATSYDDWILDHEDQPEMQFSLRVHVDYYLDMADRFPKVINPGRK